MLGAGAADCYVSAVVVLSLDGVARQAPEHVDLADVGEGVGDRALEERGGGFCEIRAGRDAIVEAAQRLMEPR